MNPWTFFFACLALPLVAIGVTWAQRLRRARRYQRLARELGLQFSRPDRFLLAPRVAGKLPVPGAAQVTVRDVAYASADTDPEGGKAGRRLLCVMTASFTIGAIGRRSQVRRVCAALDVEGKSLEHFRMIDGAPSPERYQEAHRGLLASVGRNPQV